MPLAEHKLNNYARQHLDVYALILPYRVNVTSNPGEGTTSSSVSATQARRGVSPEMLRELRKAEKRLFGAKTPEVDTFVVSSGGVLDGEIAVLDGCKPHDRADHRAVWTLDFSEGRASRAAGAITDES